MALVECNWCGQRYEVADEQVGRRSHCQKCDHMFVMRAVFEEGPSAPRPVGSGPRPVPVSSPQPAGGFAPPPRQQTVEYYEDESSLPGAAIVLTILGVLVLIIGTAAMGGMSQPVAMVSNLLITIAGLIVGIRMLIASFRIHVGWGLAVLLAPCIGPFVFCIAKFHNVRQTAVAYFCMLGIVLGGGGLAGLIEGYNAKTRYAREVAQRYADRTPSPTPRTTTRRPVEQTYTPPTPSTPPQRVYTPPLPGGNSSNQHDTALSNGYSQFLSRQRLVQIRAALDQFQDQADRQPESLDELVELGLLDAENLRMPGLNREYEYVALDAKRATSAMLRVYEPTPGDGRETVALMGGGMVQSLNRLELARAMGLTEQALREAAEPEPVAVVPPPAIPRPPVTTGNGGTSQPEPEPAPEPPRRTYRITWPSPGWEVYQVQDDHPLAGVCETFRRTEDGRFAGYAALGVGPAAEGMDDAAFEDYRREVYNALANALSDDTDASAIRQGAYTLHDVEYHRLLGGIRQDVVHVLIGVQDGRCVSYWYVGPPSLYPRFTPLVGAAEVE